MERRRKRRAKIDNDSSLDTNTNTIPTDIVNEILQRLPLKSIGKFVTVSKSWATIIRSNYFINSFSLQRSMEQQQQPHSRLLFAIKSEDHWSFFSSSSSSVNLATNDHENSPLELKFISRTISQFNGRFDPPIYVKGLLSFINGRTQLISNPSTGKSIVLPVVKNRSRFFGFDPIKAEYKVLCIIDSMDAHGSRFPSLPNLVLTVGTNSLWRETDVWIPHRPHHSQGICIDGIIYYLAYDGLLELILVRFDVNSEKFLKELPCSFLQPLGVVLTLVVTLINYDSKLAITHQKRMNSIDLWVLEDGKKLGWLKISLNVFPMRRFITSFLIEILGTTPNGEIIYTSYVHSDSFYVIYHDHKRNQHRRVQFKGKKGCICSSFIDYAESVMLL